MQPPQLLLSASWLHCISNKLQVFFFLLHVLSSECLMRALKKHALETRTARMCLHGCNKASLCQNLSVSDQTGGVMHSLPGCWTASCLHTSRL